MPHYTKAQLQALKAVWLRPMDSPHGLTYRQFRRTAFPAFHDCLMVPWAGMTLGIETDGYTHS